MRTVFFQDGVAPTVQDDTLSAAQTDEALAINTSKQGPPAKKVLNSD